MTLHFHISVCAFLILMWVDKKKFICSSLIDFVCFRDDVSKLVVQCLGASVICEVACQTFMQVPNFSGVNMCDNLETAVPMFLVLVHTTPC